MSCPLKSVALRKAIAHVLLVPELSGVLCSFDRLIAPLLGLGGGGVSNDFVKIDHHLLVSAFRCGECQYTLPYLDLGIDEVGSDVSSLLLVRVAQRRGKSDRVYEFGRFSSASDIKTITSAGSRDSMSFHPLDQPSVKRSLDKRIPQNVKDDLRFFLQKEMTEQKTRQLANAKKSRAREAKKAISEAKQQRRQQRRRNQEAQQNHPIRLVQCHHRFAKSQGEIPVCRMRCS